MFGLALCDHGCAAAFSLSRCASVLRAVSTALFAIPSLATASRRWALERLDVHVGDDLTGGDEVPFIHQFVEDAACYLSGNVDLRGLDAPVAAGESVRQLLGQRELP